MHIQLNGERRTVSCGATIADLLRELAIRPDRVAVEVNLEIVDREDFTKRVLLDGDRVEVISFIGGGGIRRCHNAHPSLRKRTALRRASLNR